MNWYNVAHCMLILFKKLWIKKKKRKRVDFKKGNSGLSFVTIMATKLTSAYQNITKKRKSSLV